MTGLAVRAAQAGDAAAIARIHRAARETIPLTNALHSLDEVIAYHAALIAAADVRVAVDGAGEVLGYAARQGDVLAQLYVAPEAQRKGLGAALLGAMRAERALTLWCFSHNTRALAFWRRFGAIEIGREEGSENEEGLPALRFALGKL